jgi:hypothetical protein
MDLASVRWPAVVACVVFSMVSGSIWYGPKTLFPIWWQAIGMKQSDTPHGTPVTWVLIIAASFVQSMFMGLLVNALGRRTGGPTMASGAIVGFSVWVGLVAPGSLTNKLFPGYLKAWAIEAGNHLINLVAFGAILGAWH